jgi:galactosylceramidase
MKPARLFFGLILLFAWAQALAQAPVSINVTLDGKSQGRIFEGIGLVNSSGTSKLLADYPLEQAQDILDLLFKPFHGAGFTIVKNEIGADVNSSTGTEPCHRRSAEEKLQARGINFWICSEALKRNPAIQFDAARWGIPAWADASAETRTDYYLTYVRLMGLNGTPLNQLSPGENESALDRDWTVKSLRPALDANAFQSTHLIAMDEVQDWKLAETLKKDKELKKTLTALTSHYTTTSTQAAKDCGLPLYNDEADVPMHDLYPRLMTSAKNLAKQYVDGRMVRALFQPALDGVYATVKYNTKGILTAVTPWSGHYEIHKSLWMVAHFTQFALPGWKFLDKSCGNVGENLWYVTLRDPQTANYSVIVVNAGDQEAFFEFKISGGLSQEILHAWRTDSHSTFLESDEILPQKGHFQVKVPPQSLLSLTTTIGQTKGEPDHPIPPVKAFPLPYREDFSWHHVAADQPKYFLDQAGAFETTNMGTTFCLKQVVTVPPREWQGTFSKREPYTVFGDPSWVNVKMETSVLLPEGATAYISIRGNLHDRDRNVPASGYQTVLQSDGSWTLRKVVFGDITVLAQGKLENFHLQDWHRLGISAFGEYLEARVDGKLVSQVQDKDLAFGQAALGCSYHAVCFRDLSILPNGDSPAWAMINDRDSSLRYKGEWLDVDGDWKDTERTCRVSQAVSATMEFDFEGTGVCILGRRSSNCGQAEFSLDDGKGEVIPLHQAVELSRMPLFRKDDLEPGKHKVRLTVLGPSDPSQKDAFVYLDGILVEKPSPLAVATTDPGDEEAMALEMDPEPETAKPAKKPKTSKTITKTPTTKTEKTPAK